MTQTDGPCEVHPRDRGETQHEHCSRCGTPVWPEDRADHVCPPGFLA